MLTDGQKERENIVIGNFTSAVDFLRFLDLSTFVLSLRRLYLSYLLFPIFFLGL
jgi:hypothetical protein